MSTQLLHLAGSTPNSGTIPQSTSNTVLVPDLENDKKKSIERDSTLPFAQSAALALTYMFGCISFFLLIRYSKNQHRLGLAPEYDNASAVFLMELVKWLFSVGMMYYRTGKFLPVSIFKEESWRIGVYYAVPSGIYALYNNLTYWNLDAFDPGTYQVFMQTRVIFTGLVYCYLLKKTLSQQKWIALVVLTVGVSSKYFSFNMKIDWRVSIMLFQASLSALAGVYNEFLLKRDISMDVNEQNFFMYSFALLFNSGYGLYSNPESFFSFATTASSNTLLLLIVLNGATVGIVTSLILKFINVIIKAFASACEVLLTAVFAWMLLGETLTIKDFIASAIVMGSIYLYYTAPATAPVEEKSDEKEVAPLTATSRQ